MAERILGIDLGANSVGWALVDFEDGAPVRLVGVGSRVFEAGVDGQIEQGKDQSRAVERREARMRRRMAERRVMYNSVESGVAALWGR